AHSPIGAVFIRNRRTPPRTHRIPFCSWAFSLWYSTSPRDQACPESVAYLPSLLGISSIKVKASVKNMRAVIYARYSSELQRDASIEDQIRLCRRRIEQDGWQYLHAYTDRAISGASALRPAYQALLEGARRAEFDIVVAE